MSGIDATFLYFETPSTHMHVLGVILLDPSTAPEPWTRATVADLLRSRLPLLEPFRRKLLMSSTRLRHPVWVDVPDVDVAAHVGHIKCPAPGGPEQLDAVIADFASRKLDRRKPLWRVLEVDGLADGKVALVIKVHHCAVDGVGAAEVLGGIFDISPEGRTPEQLAEAGAAAEQQQLSEPGALRRGIHITSGIVTFPWEVAKLLPSVGRSVVGVLQSRSSEESEGGAVPFAAPRAPFNGGITGRRVVARADIAMADVKAVRNAAGGTFNDAVIAICGGAFRHYLSQRDELPSSSLIAVCPVSVRREDSSAGGNQVSAMFTSLATDLDDPLERLAVVRRANDVGKADQAAVGDDLLSQAAQLAPPTAIGVVARTYTSWRLADRHPVVHNAIISNVPGPPIQIYVGGAKVEGLYPLGPVLEGPGLNITVVSYRDRVGFGFIACKDNLPALHDLAAAVPVALEELLTAAKGTETSTTAGAPPRKRPARAKQKTTARA